MSTICFFLGVLLIGIAGDLERGVPITGVANLVIAAIIVMGSELITFVWLKVMT